MIIYKTTNLISGKIYVGQYSKDDNNYLGSGIYLKRSIRKYGRENFIRETICECSSQEELNEMERYWIEKLDAKNPVVGYNIADGGRGGFTGFHSDETKEKISVKLKSSDKFKMSMKIRDCSNIGAKVGHNTSEETKQKISNSLIGNIPGNKGKHKLEWSEATRKSWETRIKNGSWVGKSIIVNGVRYNSRKDASKIIGVSYKTIYRWTKCGKAHYE